MERSVIICGIRCPHCIYLRAESHQVWPYWLLNRCLCLKHWDVFLKEVEYIISECPRLFFKNLLTTFWFLNGKPRLVNKSNIIIIIFINCAENDCIPCIVLTPVCIRICKRCIQVQLSRVENHPKHLAHFHSHSEWVLYSCVLFGNVPHPNVLYGSHKSTKIVS